MAIAYKPMKLRSEYERALGGDAKKISDFNKVWAFITTIPLTTYISDYNTLERTHNITGMATLDSTIKAAIASIEAEKRIYTDIGVQAPLNDYLIRLREVEREIDRETKAYTTPTKGGFLHKVFHAARSSARTAADAYSKFSKPGRDVYNFAERTIESGGENIYTFNPFKRK